MSKLKYTLIAAVSLALGLCAGIWIQKERVVAQGTACTSNLRLIDSAKEQAAQHLGLKKGDTIPLEDAAQYCKNGILPTCPAGGTYTINAVGYSPKCSLDPRETYLHRLAIIEQGEVIEDYPTDARGHSCLMLGLAFAGRPVHVVCAPKDDYLAVITAYLPDEAEWSADYKIRSKK